MSTKQTYHLPSHRSPFLPSTSDSVPLVASAAPPSPTRDLNDSEDDNVGPCNNETEDSDNSTSDEDSTVTNKIESAINNNRDPRFLLQNHFLSYFPTQEALEEANILTTQHNQLNPSNDNNIINNLPSNKKVLFTATQCHTLDDAVHLRLMNLCQQIRAPMYAFDHILQWAQQANLTGYNFPTDAPSRKTYLDGLYKQFNMQGAKPIETEITLHPDKKATVVTFSFTEMVHSLLSDKVLMDSTNLILQPSDPDICGDINTGSWYHSAHAKLCTSPQDILCPIILFIDKTQIDTQSKWSLEPVLFTLGIFNRSTRNLSQAWRPLGLVTNTIRMSSATHAGVGKQVSHSPCTSIKFISAYLSLFVVCCRVTACRTTTE
jgi:hypothetical protein